MVWSVAFAPDGRQLVAGAADGAVTLHALPDGAARALVAHRGRVTRVAFTPAGDAVVSGDDAGGLWVTTLATGATRRLRGHDAEIGALAFDPAGARLASADLRGRVRLWDLATGAVARLDAADGAIRALQFTATGALAVGGPDGRLLVVELAADALAPASPALHAWLAARTRAVIQVRDELPGPHSE